MTTVGIPVQLHLLIPDREPLSLGGSLLWDSAAPIEVQLTIAHGRALETTWLIGRDLLTAGLHGRAGELDVRIHPHPTEAHLVQVDLSSPDGRASLTVGRQILGDFLRSTWLVLPAAQEQAVIQAALDAVDWTAVRVSDETDGAQ